MNNYIKVLLLISALVSFSGAAMLFFIAGEWYGALGWIIVGIYQLSDIKPNWTN